MSYGPNAYPAGTRLAVRYRWPAGTTISDANSQLGVSAARVAVYGTNGAFTAAFAHRTSDVVTAELRLELRNATPGSIIASKALVGLGSLAITAQVSVATTTASLTRRDAVGTVAREIASDPVGFVGAGISDAASAASSTAGGLLDDAGAALRSFSSGFLVPVVIAVVAGALIVYSPAIKKVLQ